VVRRYGSGRIGYRATLRMQSAKSGVSRVLGLPARLISVPEVISVPKAYIRSCHVLTVTLVAGIARECRAAYLLGMRF